MHNIFTYIFFFKLSFYFFMVVWPFACFLWQYILWWSLMCKICCHLITGLFCQHIILPGCLSLHNSLPRAALSKSWENIYTSQFCVPGLFSSQIIWEWNNVRGGHNLQRYYTLGHRGCLASGTLPSQKKSTLLAKNIALLQQIPLRLSAKQPHLFFPSNLDLQSTAHILM